LSPSNNICARLAGFSPAGRQARDRQPHDMRSKAALTFEFVSAFCFTCAAAEMKLKKNYLVEVRLIFCPKSIRFNSIQFSVATKAGFRFHCRLAIDKREQLIFSKVHARTLLALSLI